jgi:predicted phosphodiesterase
MTRIGIIADVHGNLPALEAVAADIASRRIDRVVNLGDHVSGPLWPRETAAFLIQKPWTTIAGNHDRQVAFDDPDTHGPSDRFAWQELTAGQRHWLSTLPVTAVVADLGLLLCHGTPASDDVYLLETVGHGRLHLATGAEVEARLGSTAASTIACGHSHVPRLVSDPLGRTCVNPGSVGLQAYHADDPAPHVMETGAPAARYAIAEFAHGIGRVEFVAIPYDCESAASRARHNDRPDWERAVRTGYVMR